MGGNIAAEENIEKLKLKLRELFQLDRGDLDFGLYRIMALKRKEVCTFLDEDLLPQVKTALGDIAESHVATLQAESDALEKTLKAAGADPNQATKFVELQKSIAHAKQDERIEADTYNHLYNFFARYYDEGDFMSLRRYKSAGKESYAIPYNGEEVKLHWANADQYYIKTTENYASYVFTVGSEKKRVRFEIAAADNEKDNIKEVSGNGRFFVLAKKFIDEQDELTIRFEHRPLTNAEKTKYPKNGVKRQCAINADTEKRITDKLSDDWLAALAAPCTTKDDEERTVLRKHLTAYTAKNSFDYFIHKDLGGFLRRELDYYLKNEVISIDHLELADDPALFMRSLAQVKAIKVVGQKIINFLAQLEDFQKQLWLKKKFVLETNYCVTLDKVPEALYEKIAKNKTQRDEWKQLFATDELNGGKNPGAKFLKANPYLVLDTKHFDQAFTDKLLASLSDNDDIEEQMNGLLIHGENFQALNLLQEKYREQVQCIHIDPPYNTNTSGFPYKNNYRHSSWMAMMENRLKVCRTFMDSQSSLIAHIDDNEYERLFLLCEMLGLPNAGTVVWDKRNPMLGRLGIATQHEYILWRASRQIYERNVNRKAILLKADEIVERHGGATEKARKEFARWVRQGAPGLSGGERAYQYLDENGRVYQSVSMGAGTPSTDRRYFLPIKHPVTKKDCPVPNTGWSRPPETMGNLIHQGDVIFGADEKTMPRLKVYLTASAKKQASSVMQETGRGKTDIQNLGLTFPYCHPASLYVDILGAAAGMDNIIVLDFFAGSGTNGDAVIRLNREENSAHKYILVEVGHHFDTALLPRMKKVTYSKDWKNGKPQNREGVSQLFQYIRLESYEDALDNLVRTSSPDMQQLDMLDEVQRKQIAEDYQLRYALGEETVNSTTLLGKDFINPFNYTLSVVRDGVRRDQQVDLPETFNFLLGLKVTRRQRLDDVLAINGTTSSGENCLILWRNMEQMDATKLDQWFTKHRKKLGTDLNVIYVNGDNTLAALGDRERWEVAVIELAFRELMFKGDA